MTALRPAATFQVKPVPVARGGGWRKGAGEGCPAPAEREPTWILRHATLRPRTHEPISLGTTMPDISADNPDLPGEDVSTARDTRAEGDLRVARDLRITRDLHVDGDVVGHDKVVHGYSAEQVQRLIADLAAQYQPRPFDGRCPYPGLESFRESEADLFFGREPLVVELCQRVSASSALVVTGPSGNGKSSLVQAGLIPALKAADARGNSRYASITPGRSPLQALGRALAGLTHSLEAEDDLGRRALADDTRLARWLNITSADQPAQQVVLVVDQFEEVFAQKISEDERRAFIAQLSTAAEQAAPILRLVLVVRSDFIGACARYPHLNRLLSANLIQIEDLGPSELLRAISVPALRVGLRLDPELVSRIIADVRDAPGALPLMQFALRDLFEAECGSDGVFSLTLEAYLRRGGLHEALRRHADAVFAALTVEQQALARDILTGLVSVGQSETAPLTRHTARLSELPGPREGVAEVVGKLSAGRLLTVTGREGVATDGPIGESTATLAHETLLEAWPLLVNLVGERRELIRLRSTVIDDATEWSEHGRDLSYLYSGARLAHVLEATRSAQLRVPDHASAFLKAAQVREQELAVLVEANRNAELVRERRVANQLRTRNHWITLAALLAVMATAAAIWYALNAQAESQTSLALALAAQARQIPDTLPRELDRAGLLAIESLKRSPSVEANLALVEVLDLLPNERTRFNYERSIGAVALSPDGAWAVTGSTDGTLWIWNTTTGQERAHMAHDGQVMDVAFSPNGEWIATGSLDGTARVWDAITGQERSRMTHQSVVNAVAVSSDGAWVVSGSSDGTARVWDPATGRERSRINHDAPVIDVAFSPDGIRVASGSADHSARIWDASTGREQTRLQHDGRVNDVVYSPDGYWILTTSVGGACIWYADTGLEYAHLSQDETTTAGAFSADGKWVVIGGYSGIVRIWNVATAQERVSFSEDAIISAVAFSPDGLQVATAGWDNTARIWDVETGQERARMTHQGEVYSVMFGPDGTWVVSGSGDGTARVWSEASGQKVASVTHAGPVHALSYSPDGTWVVSGSDDGTTRVWNALSGQEHVRATIDASVFAVAYSPDGTRVASASSDSTIRIWDAVTGLELIRMQSGSPVDTMAFSPDSSQIVTGSNHGDVHVWSTVTGEASFRIFYQERIIAVDFSQDGRWILAGSGRNVEVWNAANGTGRAHMSQEANITAASFSPDGAWVVSGGSDGIVHIWNSETGKELVHMSQETAITTVAFSPDERWVASGSVEGIVRVWNATTGDEQAHIIHDADVSSIAFSPDSEWVISGSNDQTARVWLAETGQEQSRMTHKGPVIAVSFSPDGTRVATASLDGTARVWLWRVEELISLACERITRNLTQTEWQRYLGNQMYRKTCNQWPSGN